MASFRFRARSPGTHAAGFSLSLPRRRPVRVPGSRDHYALDAATFAAWGVDYIKLDWCAARLHAVGRRLSGACCPLLAASDSLHAVHCVGSAL